VNKSKGMDISVEWTVTGVTTSKNALDKAAKMKSLRTKLSNHASSKAHTECVKISNEAKNHSDNVSTTAKIFRTAYYVAKNNRPYTDFEKLVDLQQSNHCDMGITLHSRYSAHSITQLISEEMCKRLCASVIRNDCKVSIMMDESTTVSKKVL